MTHPAVASHTNHRIDPPATVTASAAIRVRRWLYESHLRPLVRSVSREEIDVVVQARTRELEREISDLREQIDQRVASERELAKEKAAAEATVAARHSALAAISHELRAPLNGILSMTNLLRQTALTPEQAELVRTVSRGGEWLLGIVNDVLDFSKIEAGRVTLESVDFDLPEELQLVVDLHSEEAASKGLELIVDIDPAVPTRLRGDPLRLRQVMSNLVNNAVKFTERGEVAVQIKRDALCDGRMRLRIDVVDTGAGISVEAQRALFQPFVQADAATARQFGGTGLGLAICQRLVALMGGEIGLVSSPGTGSRFWFTVMVDAAEDGCRACDRERSPLVGRHVLIVDDNATNRTVFAQFATSWKMHAGVAETAPNALAYLRVAARAGRPVELVLIDRDLVGTDGLALAQAIARESLIPRPALAMLTRRGNRLSPAEFDAGGIAAAEAKPIHPQKLRGMLERALGACTGAVRTEALAFMAGGNFRSRSSSRSVKTLVVEPSAVCQKVIVHQLQNLGCDVDLVANGPEAIGKLREGDYDVVFTGLQLPDLEGADVVQLIRENQRRREPGFGNQLCIVGVVASALPGDREKCLTAGIDEFVSKPLTSAALREILARLPVTA